MVVGGICYMKDIDVECYYVFYLEGGLCGWGDVFDGYFYVDGE